MRWVIVTGLLALCACTSRAERAEKQYEMVKRAGASAAEICARSKEVVDAYLQAGDEAVYRRKKVAAE